jgi:hypothetical protein
MALGPIQLWSDFRNKYLYLHRVLGYIYMISIILGTVGSLFLIMHTSNGLIVAIGFFLLALIWAGSMAMAFISVRNHRIKDHRLWMIRNYRYLYFKCSI